MPVLTIHNHDIHYSIRRSNRTKRCHIYVKPDKVELVIPPRHSLKRSTEFLNQHKDWIYTRWRHYEHERHTMLPSLSKRQHLLYHGSWYPVHIHTKGAVIPEIHFDSSEGFHIVLPPHIPNSQYDSILASLISTWLKSQLIKASQIIIDSHPHKPTKLTIRHQKTRWGSCSTKRVINLNAHLIFVPLDVFRYVLIHELCHLEHMNHSKQFWLRVAEFCPDYKRHVRWLKQQSIQHHYFPWS